MAKDKTGSTSLVRYGTYDLEEAKEDRQEFDSRGDSRYLTIKEGKTIVRMVPPLPDRKKWIVTMCHWIDVPTVGRVRFNCPRLMGKQFCKTCELEKKLLATGDTHDEKRAKSIKAKRRCYANVIDRAHEADGPKVFEFGVMIEDQLIALREDEDEGGNFVDPVKGFDLKIIRKGTGQNDTEYKVLAANKGKVLPLHEDVAKMNEWIEGQSDLLKFAKVPTADEIDAKLSGEDKDDDARPRKGSSKRDEDDTRSTRAKPSKSVDDDLDDLDAVDTDAEEISIDD
jgi:hypothetical protein